jgi:hypothetical protein
MIARDGKFGRDYYELFSSAKVVLNGAVGVAAKIAQIRDTFEAGAFRGNSGSDPDIQTFWKGMFRISLHCWSCPMPEYFSRNVLGFHADFGSRLPALVKNAFVPVLEIAARPYPCVAHSFDSAVNDAP